MKTLLRFRSRAVPGAFRVAPSLCADEPAPTRRAARPEQELLPLHAGQGPRRRGTCGSEEIKRRVLVASGLWPMPEKTPLNAVIHGRIERDDYTVEKVFFESLPGHFVTGNLYLPKKHRGQDSRGHLSARPLAQRPLHAAASDADVKKEIAIGRGEDRERGALAAAGALRAARADGLRGLLLRHARLRGQRAVLRCRRQGACIATARRTGASSARRRS